MSKWTLVLLTLGALTSPAWPLKTSPAKMTSKSAAVSLGTSTAPATPLPLYTPSTFREMLRMKLKMANENVNLNTANGGDAEGSGYSPLSSSTQSPLGAMDRDDEEEALHLENSHELANSGEELHAMLGVETTSVVPFEAHEPRTVLPVQQTPTEMAAPRILGQLKEEEDGVEVEGQSVRRPSTPQATSAQRFKAAVHTKHTFEYRPVKLGSLEGPVRPKIIEVEAKSLPLEIHFKSASSRVKLVQTHASGELARQPEPTVTEEEPQRLVHLVHKPILQEVREIITPYRRIIQEIKPVHEEIHTVISHQEQNQVTSVDSATSLGATSSSTTTTTNTASGKLQTGSKVQKPVPSKTSGATTTSASVATGSGKNRGESTQQQPIQQIKIEQVKETSGSGATRNQIRQQVEQFIKQEQKKQQQQQQQQQQQANRPMATPYGQPSYGSSVFKAELEPESIEIVDGNDLEAIVPAKLMQEILQDYAAKQVNLYTMTTASGNKPTSGGGSSAAASGGDGGSEIQLQRQQQQLLLPTSTPRPRVRPQPRPAHESVRLVTSGSGEAARLPVSQPSNPSQPARLQQQKQQQSNFNYNYSNNQNNKNGQRAEASKHVGSLRASSSTQNWHTIRPYVFYGMQHQQPQHQQYQAPYAQVQRIQPPSPLHGSNYHPQHLTHHNFNNYNTRNNQRYY